MFGKKILSKYCGVFVVIKYDKSDNVKIMFLKTGTVKNISKKTLFSKLPRVHDPMAKTVFGKGCIGVGHYKAHFKGRDTKAYSIWRAMLRRCYYEPESKPWREGCYVDEKWLNFQNFASWFEGNYPRDGVRYQLDKDIKKPGNKCYSEDNCMFVSQIENLKARRFKNKIL